MPCYDKKLEASRSDFYSEAYSTRDVDCVLTTGELDLLLQERGFQPYTPVPGESSDLVSTVESPFPELLVHPGTSSGSYLQTLLNYVSSCHSNPTTLEINPIRSSQDHIEYLLRDATTGEVLFKGAKCYGFRNLQNLVRKVGKETGTKGSGGTGRSAGAGKVAAAVAARRKAAKAAKLATAAGVEAQSHVPPISGSLTPLSAVSSATSSVIDLSTTTLKDSSERTLDYVEVMACPGGCVNGGGQMKPGSSNAATTSQQQQQQQHGKDDEGYSRDWEMDGVVAAADSSHQSAAVDRHQVVQVDEGMRWSTKSWVNKVEAVYWNGLVTPPTSPPLPSATPDTAAGIHKTHTLQAAEKSHPPILCIDQSMEASANELAMNIIAAIAHPSDPTRYVQDADPRAEERRRRFLRTSYRKVEGDVSGLTAKW